MAGDTRERGGKASVVRLPPADANRSLRVAAGGLPLVQRLGRAGRRSSGARSRRLERLQGGVDLKYDTAAPCIIATRRVTFRRAGAPANG
jgi:hypothetical protein